MRRPCSYLPGDSISDAAIETPVLLVGSERSGTTLLRLMLDHHPALAIHLESEFIVSRLPAAGDSWPDMDAYCEWLEEDRIFLHGRFTIQRGLSYPQLMRSFLQQKLKRDNKLIVGVTIHHAFDLLPRIWSRAKYIHIVRDPRDVARSVIQMRWAGNFYHAADTWLTAEQTWERLKNMLSPADYIEVRYEDLIREHEKTLSRICEFLGADYSERMLDYVNDSTYELPDIAFVEQWKQKLTPRQIGLVESKCGNLMRKRGYIPTGNAPLRLSPLKRSFLRVQSYVCRSKWRLQRYGASLIFRSIVARKFGYTPWLRSTREQIRLIDDQHLR